MEQIMAQIKAILKADLGEIKSVVKHYEVSKEESSVEAIGALEDRCGDRHLVVGRLRQQKKRTQGDGGSRKKLAAVRSRLTCHAISALRREIGHKGPTVEKKRRKKRTKEYVVRGAPKGRTFEKRRRTQLKFNTGIRDRGLTQELRVGNKNKTLCRALGQTHELEVMNRAIEIPIKLREVSYWKLWRRRPPPKRKRHQKHSRREKMMMVVHLDRLAAYQGTARDERP
jgi:hypothetical protein